MPTLPIRDSDFDRVEYFKPKTESGGKSPSKRGYNRKWKQARLRHLAKHPFCVECEEKGILNNGLPGHPNHVDHIIPHRGNKKLFWDKNNWQTLCENHHNRKTGRRE